MVRTDDIIGADVAPWLIDEGAQRVCRFLTEAGRDVYFVGGCVRNAVLKAPASDIDLSTNALPQEVMNLARDAGIKVIPTGIEHGTVTLVVAGEPFEITTFRRDVETDGRRAVVAFSDNIREDALRRDFTMNALYATPQGRIVDPLGGLPDAKARRVRFIEDAEQRIKEDYLRSLRFFRFSAWYSDVSQGLDAEALHAIAVNLEGLRDLSGERIGAEVLKFLAAPDPSAALAAMRQTGALNAVLPGAEDRWLSLLVHMEQELALQPDSLRRLAILGGTDAAQALRLSKKQARDLDVLRTEIGSLRALSEVAYDYGSDLAWSVAALRAAMMEMPPPQGTSAEITLGCEAVFPVKAEDIIAHFQGPALGKELKALKAAWVASGFQLTKAQLLG